MDSKTKYLISMSELNVLVKIHDLIFKKINEQYVDVFLCGGASSARWASMRDQVRDGLRTTNNIRILYPEDLFMEILNKDKNSDLLSLEEFLAENCDVICIICESPGSLVELGAFTNDVKTREKVISVIEEKYQKQKSFIMTGPVKLIKKNNKDNVVFYNTKEPQELIRKLQWLFRGSRLKKMISSKGKHQYTLETLIGLYYFIPLLLYFYHDMNVSLLDTYLKRLYIELGYDLKYFDRNYMSSIKLLHKEKLIHKFSKDNKVQYSLTKNGYNNISRLLKGAKVFDKDLLYNGIRFNIMKKRYY